MLAADYGGLFKRLTRRLGSAELACEALHETFLRVERVTDVAEVRSPRDSLFRIALNVATDRRRTERPSVIIVEVMGYGGGDAAVAPAGSDDTFRSPVSAGQKDQAEEELRRRRRAR